MPFLDPIIARDDGSGRWILAEPLRYQGHTDEFEVPGGFPTDFASVPRIVQSIAPKMGRQNRAAVLHDYLYALAPLVLRKSGYRRITRKESDGLFRRCMREDRVNVLRRWVFYYGVRLGGWLTWRRYRG